MEVARSFPLLFAIFSSAFRIACAIAPYIIPRITGKNWGQMLAERLGSFANFIFWHGCAIHLSAVLLLPEEEISKSFQRREKHKKVEVSDDSFGASSTVQPICTPAGMAAPE